MINRFDYFNYDYSQHHYLHVTKSSLPNYQDDDIAASLVMAPVELLVVKLVLNILFKVPRIGGQGCASRIPQVEMMMMMMMMIRIMVFIVDNVD